MTGPDIDKLVETVREGIGAVDTTDLLVGLTGAEVRRVESAFAALSDLAARARDAERRTDLLNEALDRAEAAEADRDRLARRVAELEAALREIEDSALKAAQILPMTLSTSVERDHRDDHPSWAGWLLRHKVLPAIRAALAGDGGGA